MPEFVTELVAWLAAEEMGALALTATGWQTVAVVALTAYSSNQARQAKQHAKDAYNAGQVDRLVNAINPVGPRELVLGRVRKGGTIFFQGSAGTNKETFVRAIAIAAHEIDAVETIYFNDTAVTLDASGYVTNEPWAISRPQSGVATVDGTGSVTLPYAPIAGSVHAYVGHDSGLVALGETLEVTATVSGNTVTVASTYANWAVVQYQYIDAASKARVWYYLGTPNQNADARMMELFPDQWTVNHRARGIAYIVCEYTYDETAFAQGLPTVTALVRGAKVYDPRSTLNAWSDNPALLMRHVYAHSSFGKATVTSTEDTRISTAANACDTSTTCVTMGATNLLTYGSDFTNAVWTKVTTTITADSAAAPDGSTTADLLAATGANSGAYQQIVATPSTQYTFQVWLKGSSGAVVLNISVFDSAGTTTNVSVTTSTTDWTLCTATVTAAGGATWVRGLVGGGSTFTTGEQVLAWGANLAVSTSSTVALYRAGLVLPYGSAAKGALDDLAQAMAGQWAFAGGELYCKAGTYTSSVMSLTEADLAVVQRSGEQEAQAPIGISVHRERAQRFNVVKCQIWDDSQAYKQADITPLRSIDLIARDGVELAQQVSMPAVSYAPQALHIAGCMLRDARDPLVVTVPFKLKAYPLELFDTIDLTLSRYGWSAKTFMVVGRQWGQDASLMLTLKETSAAITTPNAAFSAQGSASNTSLPSPWDLPAIGALTITSGTAELQKLSDGTVISRMRISWPAVDDFSVTHTGQVEVQYRRADETGEWTSVMVSGAETQVVVSPVIDTAWYTVRARCRSKVAVGVWNTQVAHRVVGQTEPPASFDTFTVVTQPDGTRQFDFAYTTTTKPLDYAGAVVRYVTGTSTPAWSTMTALHIGLLTTSPWENNLLAAGDYSFAICAQDWSGNQSTTPKYCSVTLGNRRRGTVVAEYWEHTEGWLGTKTGCQVLGGIIESLDTTTWTTSPATWTAWTRWNMTPTSPIYYETPVRDLATSAATNCTATIDADGTLTQEWRGSTVSSADVASAGYTAASGALTKRWVQYRLTVTATGPLPIPIIRSLYVQFTR